MNVSKNTNSTKASCYLEEIQKGQDEGLHMSACVEDVYLDDVFDDLENMLLNYEEADCKVYFEKQIIQLLVKMMIFCGNGGELKIRETPEYLKYLDKLKNLS